MIKLFHNDMSVCAQKVRFVLAYKQIDWISDHLNLRAGDQFKPEFRQINPKGLIPVLLHDEAIITESNTIIEYLEEVFPKPVLMPSNPVTRAKVRYWMIKLDAGLHDQVAVISFCLAFRFQLLERYQTEQEVLDFIKGINDPYRAAVMKDTVINGLQSERLSLALYAYNKLLIEMNDALADCRYLVGDDISLADASMLPYIERLAQLKLDFMWADKPHLEGWYALMKSSEAYKIGFQDWHNPNYIELMSEKAEQALPEVKKLIESLNPA